MSSFTSAVSYANNCKQSKSLSNNQLLDLYALYKQATVGKCNTSKPGFLDIKGKAKWEAWNGLGNMNSKDAETEYITKVNQWLK